MSYEYLCVIPDVEGAQPRRMECRPRHLENALSLAHEGKVSFAGAMLESFVPDGQVPNFRGSTLVVKADSEAEARALLATDIYAERGVWDLEKAQIYAFKRVI